MRPAAPPTDVHSNRLRSLDAWRGVCAVVVFLSHWHPWCNFTPMGEVEQFFRALGDQANDAFMRFVWPTGGHHPAVIAFFVLSGFCIHYPIARRAQQGEQEVNWQGYFKRRFFRIMPVYWAACGLGLLFVAAQTWAPAPNALLEHHAESSTADIVVRLAGLGAVWPSEIFAGNYILVTVAVEMLLYALYPVFHYHAARGRWAGLGLAFLALHLAALPLLRWVTPFWVFNSVFIFGLFWYAGAYAAHLQLAGRNRARAWWPVAAYALFLGLKSAPSFYGLNMLKQAAWGMVAFCGLLWLVQREQAAPILVPRRREAAGRWLADISYSLYSVHTPAVMLASWALLQLGIAHYSLQLAATLTASAIAVLGTHYLIERRFYRPSG